MAKVSQKTLQERAYAAAYDARPGLPMETLVTIKPCTWVRLKWTDAPDSVALVTSIDVVKKKVDDIKFLDPNPSTYKTKSFSRTYWNPHADISQIVEILGPVQVPELK